jgi:uncharacterized protein YciI
MLFVIQCLDKPEVAEIRAAHMPAHRDYTAAAPITILLSGPLTDDDGEAVVGSFFLVDADDRAAVDVFQANDPLFAAGIWKSISVFAFSKRVDNLS